MAQTIPTAPQATTISALAPAAVAFDAAGNLFLAVRGEHVIRRVDVFGAVTTVAGTGEQGFSGDGGQATSADLDSPSGVAVDAKGTLYIADTHNNRIRTVSNGTISTLAGTGVAGNAGDGAAAIAAQLAGPSALSVDAAGTLYIADTLNNRIRKVTAGVISAFAGTGEQGYSGDGGSAVAAQLDTPMGVSADPLLAGRVYISDTHNQRLRVVDSSGIISTLAGTGTLGFSGDGGGATTATLASPRGISVAGDGTVYIADSDNQRVRALANGTLRTVVGTGEQGFAGDLGSPTSAILDTPWSVALSSTGTLALADTHNQRVRAVSGSALDTVAGLPPALTEGLVLSGPTTGAYGAQLPPLSATFSNGENVASGVATLTDAGQPVASAALSANATTFDLTALTAGVHSLVVSYPGDAANPAIASGVYVVNIAQAAQAVSLAPVATTLTYSPGLSETLGATASSGLPVSFSVSGPATLAGTTLTITGPGTVTITATQPGNGNYVAASVVQQVVVAAAPLLAGSLSPATVALGASNTTINIAGSGFTPTSVVELNGTPLTTTFVSFTSLVAVLPQATAPGDLLLTVVDPANQATSGTLDLRVTAPTANAVLSVPAQSTSGQQPGINLQLATAYPVPILGRLVLTASPAAGSTVSDPAVQLSTGGQTLTFTIPANSTTVPSVSVVTGTLAGTLTVNLTLTAAGVDVTPATARTAVISVPGQTPQIQSGHVTFTQSGAALTVTVVGFSNTRDMTQALFTFTPAPGSSVANTTVPVPVSGSFADYFNGNTARGNGSTFTYTQPFTLSDPAAVISGVSVQLVNSVGASAQATSP